jgi:hypothetical protein
LHEFFFLGSETKKATLERGFLVMDGSVDGMKNEADRIT